MMKIGRKECGGDDEGSAEGKARERKTRRTRTMLAASDAVVEDVESGSKGPTGLVAVNLLFQLKFTQ